MNWETFQMPRPVQRVKDDLTNSPLTKERRRMVRRERDGVCIRCSRPRATVKGRVRLRCEFHLRSDRKRHKTKSSATDLQPTTDSVN